MASSLCCQTILSSSLGNIERWGEYFEMIRGIGYNAVHFTPVQELGISRSAYCVYDQLSISNGFFKESGLANEEKQKKLQKKLKDLENEKELFLITDVVWNHTARNSPWLSEHPEATYNLDNCPYLRPSFEFDNALRKFSDDIVDGKYSSHQITPEIKTEADLNRIMNYIEQQLIPSLKLWEFFIVNVDEALEQFKVAVRSTKALQTQSTLFHGGEAEALKREGMYRSDGWGRFSLKVDPVWAVKLFGPKRSFSKPKDVIFLESITDYKNALNKINAPFYDRLNDDVRALLVNIENRIRFERLAHNGTKKGFPVSKDRPLVEPYFSEVVCKDGRTIHCLNNGWVWGGNPLKNFADYPAASYFRREVIIWSDLVKLNYGKRYQDNPWLWDYMKRYTESCAQLFHGFRIDNCHSTPIRVARYLMDAARRIRPNLYVMAELFTGNERIDNIFVNKLGIHSLVRESMQAYSPDELLRTVKRYGGRPIGSLTPYFKSISKESKQLKIPVISTIPPAFLFDCTHDNETPYQKRTIEDALPNAAITWMTNLPVGTTAGYDILVERNPDVCEQRLYEVFDSERPGMMQARAILNSLHSKMADEGYSEFNADQCGKLILLNRYNPTTLRSVFCCAFTSFSSSFYENKEIDVPGKISKVILACSLVPSDIKTPTHSDSYIVGSNISELKIYSDEECKTLFTYKEKITEKGDAISRVKFSRVPSGSIIIFDVCLPDYVSVSFSSFGSIGKNNEFECALANLSFVDYNYLLYHCNQEELDFTDGKSGVYNIPYYEEVPYAGIYGFVHVLNSIRNCSDFTNHPFYRNLLEGNWAIDYTLARIQRKDTLIHVYNLLEGYFSNLKQLPRFVIPKFFDIIIMKLYHASRIFISDNFISENMLGDDDDFMHDLVLSGLQFLGSRDKTPLISGEVTPTPVSISMAAGLPHFSTGYMRAWGRDTFIALRGLLLLSGRFDEARKLIFGFAASVRYGLIPNLLDSGIKPRYNARDATWWFLYSVQQYCLIEGTDDILKEEVILISDSKPYDKEKLCRKSLASVIQDIMQLHASGIHFRERGAGIEIDAHMKDEGFNVDIELNPENGFIYGGNQWNCGTWMDKMGESDEAQNRGIPATPRDGAAIELVGLLKTTVRWLSTLSKKSTTTYPYEGVELKNGDYFTYEEWDRKIQDNFEKYFYIPIEPSRDDEYDIQKKMVHRRGIYKDTHGSYHVWTDYQLRPNMLIAMVVAPELFDSTNAVRALKMVEKNLLGKLGMKTLDPKDKQYRPYYDSGNSSSDYFLGKGFNYHLGPEWLWPTGYFVRALLHFSDEDQKMETINRMQTVLNAHRSHFYQSKWNGLPELTNRNGDECYSSCRTQAWSTATIIEALYDINFASRSSSRIIYK